MEKFSTWRDKATGISPFMPVETPKTPLRKYVVDPVLVAVKLPLFVVLYYLSFLAPKPITRFVLATLFGISQIDVLVDGVRKLKTDEINRNRPGVNNVVVQNFVSPFDVFLLFSISNVSSLSSIAVLVPHDGALYRFTPWQTVQLCFGGLDGATHGTKVTKYFDELKNKLVVLLPEQTPSNNRAVLPFAAVPSALFEMPSFTTKTVVLRMYPNSLALPVPHMTPFQYLVKMLSLPASSFVKVKIVPHAKGSLALAKLDFADNGLSTVELGLAQKRDFYAYYKSYALTNFTK